MAMMNPATHRGAFPVAASVTLLLCLPLVAFADPPDGYYDSVDATNSTTLRSSLHAVIDDHHKIPYTDNDDTDTWDVLELADEDPNNSSNILDVYKNASYPKFGEGNKFYQREHTWPSSYGFPTDNSQNYPYSDCHMLFLVNGSYNGSRGNTLYRNCNAACMEKPTDVSNGQGGGTGEYPGNSNWRTGSGSTGTWETWIGRRGDVARALFYMDVRYEGGTHGDTGTWEPDLILTDNENLIVSDTQDNQPVAYMGIFTVLLQWHVEDPVDDVERNRNDAVFSFQGNRNPFIDHPEWVECVFNDDCEFCPTLDCPADFDCDGQVRVPDLVILLAAWGSSPGHMADFDCDGEVRVPDLIVLLGAWGQCS